MTNRFATIAATVMLSTFPALSNPALSCDGRIVSSAAILGETVCVPSSAQRVVVLDPFYNMVMGLDLGLPIVGAAASGTSMTPERLAHAGDIQNIGQFGEPNLEIIARLNPDLIIGDAHLQRHNQDLFARIAPTALINTSDWQTYYRTIAEVAGEAEVAKAVRQLDGYRERADEIARLRVETTLSYVRLIPGGFQVYVDGPNAYAPFRVLADAGINRTDYETVSDDTVLKRPDWESLIALQGDVLFYVVGGGHDDPDGGGAALEAEITSNPIWQMLPAVRNGRAHRVDADVWAGFGGIGSAHEVLDDVERYLLNSETR